MIPFPKADRNYISPKTTTLSDNEPAPDECYKCWASLVDLPDHRRRNHISQCNTWSRRGVSDNEKKVVAARKRAAREAEQAAKKAKKEEEMRKRLQEIEKAKETGEYWRKPKKAQETMHDSTGWDEEQNVSPTTSEEEEKDMNQEDWREMEDKRDIVREMKRKGMEHDDDGEEEGY